MAKKNCPVYYSSKYCIYFNKQYSNHCTAVVIENHDRIQIFRMVVTQ